MWIVTDYCSKLDFSTLWKHFACHLVILSRISPSGFKIWVHEDLSVRIISRARSIGFEPAYLFQNTRNVHILGDFRKSSNIVECEIFAWQRKQFRRNASLEAICSTSARRKNGGLPRFRYGWSRARRRGKGDTMWAILRQLGVNQRSFYQRL